MGQTQRVLGGRYKLRDVLGVGGMSVVWRAHDEVLGRQVAVKLLSGRYATDPVFRERIRLEARAAAALSHPNVAQVYDFGETYEDGRRTPFVVMELVVGKTLEQRAQAGPLPPKVMFRLAAEVAAALAAAHADGVVHRDIKPANIMVTPLGAKVVDFGIAVAVSAGGPDDRDGEVLGTPSYLAPERLTGHAGRPASDVYSLGVLLYRQLSGRMPWTTDGVTEILRAHLHTDPEPLPPMAGIPDAVIQLCHACLAKDPAGRPTARQAAIVLAEAAGVRAVDDDLAHTLAPAAPGGETHTVLVPRRPAAAAGRRQPRRGATALVAVGVVSAAIVAWPLLSDGPSVPRSRVVAPAGPTHSSPSLSLSPPVSPSPSPAASQPSPADAATADPATTPPAPVPAVTPTEVRNVLPATGATPAPATATTTGATTVTSAQSSTFTSSAGSVTAMCTAAHEARLVSWSAYAPYEVEEVRPGPASEASLLLRNATAIAQMSVTCVNGMPAENTATSS